MDIEKTLTIDAPASQVWGMILDPHVMGGCVPGMQSIEVVNPDEYIAVMQVKISFISAKFKLKTRIVERREASYLRTQGTGEDTSVASSLKQESEIFLSELPSGQTELRMKVHVDIIGRLGSFGLTVMKTKADRMWDEFARNLAAQLNPTKRPINVLNTESIKGSTPVHVKGMPSKVSPHHETTWWSRLWQSPRPSAASTQNIHIEIRQGDKLISVDWPLQGAQECTAWLLKMQAASAS